MIFLSTFSKFKSKITPLRRFPLFCSVPLSHKHFFFFRLFSVSVDCRSGINDEFERFRLVGKGVDGINCYTPPPFKLPLRPLNSASYPQKSGQFHQDPRVCSDSSVAWWVCVNWPINCCFFYEKVSLFYTFNFLTFFLSFVIFRKTFKITILELLTINLERTLP